MYSNMLFIDCYGAYILYHYVPLIFSKMSEKNMAFWRMNFKNELALLSFDPWEISEVVVKNNNATDFEKNPYWGHMWWPMGTRSYIVGRITIGELSLLSHWPFPCWEIGQSPRQGRPYTGTFPSLSLQIPNLPMRFSPVLPGVPQGNIMG